MVSLIQKKERSLYLRSRNGNQDVCMDTWCPLQMAFTREMLGLQGSIEWKETQAVLILLVKPATFDKAIP